MENISIEKLTKNKTPKPRPLSEMTPVLRAEEKSDPNTSIYDVYREIDLIDNFRYDITIFYSNKLKNELTKTFGHYHKGDMMEIMEVVDGKALWLLQKYNNDPSIIEEAYLVEASAGEKAVFPTRFGHLTINPTPHTTTLSNWISLNAISDYKQYTDLHGGCYYVLKNQNDEITFEKNKNYKQVPELIKLKPKEIPELGITFDKPLLNFSKDQLDFLNNPQKYKNILTIENCYTKIIN